MEGMTVIILYRTKNKLISNNGKDLNYDFCV